MQSSWDGGIVSSVGGESLIQIRKNLEIRLLLKPLEVYAELLIHIHEPRRRYKMGKVLARLDGTKIIVKHTAKSESCLKPYIIEH